MMKINIQASLSKIDRDKVRSLIGMQVNHFYIGIASKTMANVNFGDRLMSLFANEIILQTKFNDNKLVNTKVSLLKKISDQVGDYDQLVIDQVYGEETSIQFFTETNKDILNKNMGIFQISVLEKNEITSVSVFESLIENLKVEDYDFPDENFKLNLRIARLLKFDLKNGRILVIYSHDGKVALMPNMSHVEFNDFIENTKTWGSYSLINYTE